ncbi:MAG: LysR family transcriptional regulator [Planctomycetes bacterium]|nr:LysR family transcriptional regulator [Planctomycetota bacterium]
MDLHKLRGFHAVVQHGSFTAAARRLHLTQPTVSLQVMALEKGLGFQLLERGARRVRPTREGEVLYDLATRLFETETEIETLFRSRVLPEPERLAIATNQSVAAHILPPRLEVFTSKFPGVEINIHNMRTGDIAASVRDGSIDFGIVLIDPAVPGLKARKVLPYEMVLVTPRDHPLQKRRRITLSDIARYPFISYTKDTETRRLIDQPFEKVRQEISIRMALGSTDLIILYVSLGYGVSIIHNLNIDEANRVNLHVRPLQRYFSRQYIHLIHRDEETLSGAARAFIDLF